MTPFRLIKKIIPPPSSSSKKSWPTPIFYRPPSGRNNERSLKALNCGAGQAVSCYTTSCGGYTQDPQATREPRSRSMPINGLLISRSCPFRLVYTALIPIRFCALCCLCKRNPHASQFHRDLTRNVRYPLLVHTTLKPYALKSVQIE